MKSTAEHKAAQWTPKDAYCCRCDATLPGVCLKLLSRPCTPCTIDRSWGCPHKGFALPAAEWRKMHPPEEGWSDCDDQTTEPPGWYVKPSNENREDEMARVLKNKESYDCPKCKRKHHRGKIYDAHLVYFTDQ